MNNTAWNNILLNSSLFDTANAFILTSAEGNASRGPNGDLDSDTLTNYEEYTYNMPDDYDITISGPYNSHISPIKCDTDGDGLTNIEEYLYNITAQPQDYTPQQNMKPGFPS